MNILVTGSRGFIGKNLLERLKCIGEGKDKSRDYSSILPLSILEYSHDQDDSILEEYCEKADFVFNLAGVNRPENSHDFQDGNIDFLKKLLRFLDKCSNSCDIMLASSIQAKLEGRFAGSEYGKSKLQAEELLREHQNETGKSSYIFRLPNTFGKWQRPNYNSVIATFCNNIANNVPIRIDDPSVKLELLYIDDLVDSLIDCLLGNAEMDPEGFCYPGQTYLISVGEVASLISSFRSANHNLEIPYQQAGSIEKKLNATYLTYINPDGEGWRYSLDSHEDSRGIFAELLKTSDRGQVSINVSNPGITKGQHWHNTKWEKFCVVYGEGVIRQRQIGLDENGVPYPVIERKVSGSSLEVVEMLPGYTHSITNTSKTDIMITVIWCNECFDPDRPDTFAESV